MHEGIPFMKALLSVCVAALSVLVSCSRPEDPFRLDPADSLRIVQDNIRHRAAMDEFFSSAPESPFARDTTVAFHGLRWFPVDPRFHTQAALHRLDRPDTVTIMGTRGEPRRQQRYGYFDVTVPGAQGAPVLLRLFVYKFTPQDSLRYTRYRDHLSVWFTDSTTGRDTYHVGRYLEIGRENPDPQHQYTLDLNKAYNPYCAYSDLYSCAIPSDADHLDIALRVGEMNYHE